jgi:hypothetical protein
MRHNDFAFRQPWDEAAEIAADRLEAEARRRAVEGVDEPAFPHSRMLDCIRPQAVFDPAPASRPVLPQHSR